ncbi:unnamed protein product (macronuclear) [Paramecium tetraurelia]|uniref:LNR domain-containing protein n=1 Tax=Paramecium tetraurelia TaxID=5888 RepID=A0CAY7_PARTE|nr:uncharacterized protein GSPATT00036735001 [Paramecium tetraurelia]CAK67954.1 unnamed protein product [Paramecium tetraurelia]|eukprot:XP_001435351.1 hypothetical protein (macronuclear) [Paramecium tetraurelia strain d4-2]
MICENNICIQQFTDANKSTNYNNNNNTYYYNNPLENFIQAKCGDGDINQNELCDDGNLIDGDGCDSDCQPSKNSICYLNECIQIYHPVPQLKFVKSIENCQILSLTYDQKIRLSLNNTLEQYLNSLSGSVVNTKVNVSIEANIKPSQELDYAEIIIQILYLERAVDPIFILDFLDLSIIINEQELEQEYQQIQMQLASPNLLSIEEQRTTGSIILFSEYQLQIIAGLWKILNNMQMLYYYKYINIIKGQNLIKFFDTFKIIQLANFYEFIGFQPQSFIFFDVSQENSPSIFEDDGRSSNFLSAFLEVFSIFFLAYFSHLFSQIIIKKLLKCISQFNTESPKLYQLKVLKQLTKICKKHYGIQFKAQFKVIFQSLIYEYVINMMLSFQYQNNYNLQGIISLTLKIMLLILIIQYLINKQNQRFSEFQYTYSCIQKIIFSIILVGCFECPIIQIQLCAINELCYFSFLFIKRNELEKFEGFKKQFKHLTFFFMNVIYSIHEFSKKNPPNLITLGWIQIGIMSFNLSTLL